LNIFLIKIKNLKLPKNYGANKYLEMDHLTANNSISFFSFEPAGRDVNTATAKQKQNNPN
jgi:hypothetical protein